MGNRLVIAAVERKNGGESEGGMAKWRLAVGLGMLGGFSLTVMIGLAVNIWRGTPLSGPTLTIVGTITGLLIAAATQILRSNGKNEKP